MHLPNRSGSSGIFRAHCLLLCSCLLMVLFQAGCRQTIQPFDFSPKEKSAKKSPVIRLDPAEAHTLTLTLPGYQRLLNLSEIEVWAGGKNVAQGAGVKASSSMPEFPPSTVTDGITVSKTDSGKFNLLHTNFETSPWVSIALPPGLSQIDKIVIQNRNDERTSSWRIMPFEIKLSDGQGKEVWKTKIQRITGVSASTGYFKITLDANGIVKESGPAIAKETYVVKALPKPPTLEGKISDAEWGGTDPISTFKVAKAVANANSVPPTFPTEARIGSDDTGFYFAFNLPQTSGPKKKADQRDGKVWEDDSVEILIEPKAGSGDFFHWIVNAKGVVLDEHGKDPAWNGNATFSVSPWDGKEWQVVAHIPWSDLGGKPEGPRVIGFNVLRNIAGAELETSAFALIDETARRPEKFALASVNGDASLVAEYLKNSGGDELKQLRDSLANAAVKTPPGDDAPEGLRAQFARLNEIKKRGAELIARVTGKPSEAQVEEASALAQEASQLASSLPVLLEAWKQSRGTKADRFLLSTASPLKPVYLEAGRLEPDYKNSHALRAARNEFESVQVQVVPFAGDLKDVRWTLSPLTNKDGGKIEGKVFVVAYVFCEDTVYTPGNTAGWHPDGLADFTDHIEQVPVGEILNLWVRVFAPADAAPGEYSGTLTVTAGNAKPQVLNITTRVNSFALPVEPNQLTINSLVTNFDGMGKFYPADQIPKILASTEDMLLDDYKMNVGNIMCHPKIEPFHWDAARLQALKAKGIQKFPLTSLDWYKGTPEEVANAAIADIKRTLPEVEKAGLRDQAIIYGFDEWPPEKFDKMIEIVNRIKAVYPDIEVMTTALAYWGMKEAEREEARVVDIWCPLISLFDENPGLIKRLQARGNKVAWYICQFPAPPYPGIMVEQPPADMRLLLGAMAHKYKTDGFLYWAFNQWILNAEPISTLPRSEFNPNTYNGPETYNGGGHLLIPGPKGPIPTVRLESMRDGLEDNDYYVILERLLKQKGLPPDTASVPKTVVENLTHYTKDPGVIEAERNRVADEIERVSALPDPSSAAAP